MKPDEQVLDIPLNHLEKRAREQPQLMFRWGSELAKLRKATKIAKNNLKLTDASLTNEFIANPEEHGLTKTTKDAVEAAVMSDGKHQEAFEALMEAEFDEDVCEAFVNALKDCKYMIETLSSLHGQMYWSKPKTDEDSKERTRREVDETTTSNLRRKAKK